jgi:DNA-binding CsgD family transcriptional regulator/tetratricopeptide (TPR) repeat protein
MIRLPPAVGGPSLIGRARELASLRDRLDRAAAGRGSAVLVTGEAGIGKSRLTRELAADARYRGWGLAEGRCVAVGGEPLRRAALLDLLRTPGTPGLASGASTEELLERVLSLVDSASAPAPLLVVVEDLHWADRATCEVLMVLARHVADRPACLVLTSRDDELPRGHHVRGFLAELRRAQLVTAVALPRLGAADVATLIQHLVGPVEPTRASAVFERSGGNPLLVEELSIAGVGAATDASAGGGTAAGRDLEDRFVDVLLTRTERLSEVAAAIVNAVSAAGRYVDETVLAEVVDAAADRFAAGLREGLDLHLLVRCGDAVGFRHVLVGEAVHGQLLRSERTSLHARWAAVLSRRDEDPAVLAHHWAEADDPERALTASVGAGDAALGAIAPHEAMVHYRRALDLWRVVDDPVGQAKRSRTDLCALAAESANWAGAPVDAVELVTMALASQAEDDPGDGVATSRLLERQGWYLLRQGRTDAARAPYQAAVEGLPDDAPPAHRARVLAGSVRIWERQRDPARALATGQAALAAAQAAVATGASAGSDAHAAAELGQVRYMLSRALLAAGQTDAALDELAASIAAAEEAVNAVSLSISLLDRADVLAPLGRLDEVVVEALAAADRLQARGHNDPHALLCRGTAAAVLHRQGRTEPARALAESIVADARTPSTLAFGHLATGVLDLDQGRLGDAREHLEMARFLSAPLFDGRMAGSLATGRAELALAEGRADDARAAVDEGIERVACTGDDEVLCDLCLLGLRIAADRASQSDQRRSERARARDASAIARYERRLAVLVLDHTSDTDRVPDGVGAAFPGSDGGSGWERPVARTLALAWDAERARLDGAPDADAWARAADGWAAIGRPRHAALARLRQAEALLGRAETRPAAEDVLAQALKQARVVGSQLLTDHVVSVARRAGVTLAGPLSPAGTGTATAASRGNSVGPADGDLRSRLASLTRREREVLDLVAGGSTNRQIGAALYISTKTASVHVSRILAKLGVVSRREAAELAHRA